MEEDARGGKMEGMDHSGDRTRRRTIRLKGWDYASSGAYFVTICAKDRRCLFGVVVNEMMHLGPAGSVVENAWISLADRYSHASLDEYIIMPNHMHGIIVLQSVRRGGSRTAPTSTRKPLGRLIGAFKTISTKEINRLCGTTGRTIWQRGYYDHIIRNEEDLDNIRRYIQNNPLNWALDPYCAGER
jgi:putative transposase